MDEKGLVVKKENIFTRVSNFFRNLFFKKNKVQCNSEVELQKITKNKNDFNDKISGVSKLLELQKRLTDSGINEENLREILIDLSFEDKEKLKQLYIDQNESLKAEIKSYKNKIIAIKD